MTRVSEHRQKILDHARGLRAELQAQEDRGFDSLTRFADELERAEWLVEMHDSQSRADALTEEEREALQWIRNEVNVIRFDRSARRTADPYTAKALAILDRLLAKGAV